jgi:hypothetical protein
MPPAAGPAAAAAPPAFTHRFRGSAFSSPWGVVTTPQDERSGLPSESLADDAILVCCRFWEFEQFVHNFRSTHGNCMRNRGDVVPAVYLCAHPMAMKHMRAWGVYDAPVRALKGLACRKSVAAASSTAATCKQGAVEATEATNRLCVN